MGVAVDPGEHRDELHPFFAMRILAELVISKRKIRFDMSGVEGGHFSLIMDRAFETVFLVSESGVALDELCKDGSVCFIPTPLSSSINER